MNILLFKIILTIIFLLISVIINYFLICPKKKRKNKEIAQKVKKNKDVIYFKKCTIIIIGLNVVFYLLDFFIFKNELINYLATNMLLSFMLSITFEDIKTRLMDTRVIVGYFVAFLIYRIIFLDLTIFLEGLIGFVLSLIIMLIGYFIKRNSIGIGDIEVIATCGMIIGFPNIFHFLFKAFLFVFIYGCYLYIKKKFITNEKNKKMMHDEIPLAPFLLLAIII